jgi:hypothetical protein
MKGAVRSAEDEIRMVTTLVDPESSGDSSM